VALDFVLSPSDKSSPTPQKKSARFTSTLAFLQKQKQREKNNIKKGSQDSRVINYNIPVRNLMRKLLQKRNYYVFFSTGNMFFMHMGVKK
jgi:hypothetical protein